MLTTILADWHQETQYVSKDPKAVKKAVAEGRIAYESSAFHFNLANIGLYFKDGKPAGNWYVTSQKWMAYADLKTAVGGMVYEVTKKYNQLNPQQKAVFDAEIAAGGIRAATALANLIQKGGAFALDKEGQVVPPSELARKIEGRMKEIRLQLGAVPAPAPTAKKP